MLNKLWSQQDLTLQLNEHWLLVQDDHKKRAKQLKVIFDKNDKLKKENDESIYWLILEANRINENCILLREVVLKDEAQYEDIKLRNCWVQNEILYQNDLLWVFFNEYLQMKLIQEVHDQSSIDHFEILRTMKIIRRYYY